MINNDKSPAIIVQQLTKQLDVAGLTVRVVTVLLKRPLVQELQAKGTREVLQERTRDLITIINNVLG